MSMSENVIMQVISAGMVLVQNHQQQRRLDELHAKHEDAWEQRQQNILMEIQKLRTESSRERILLSHQTGRPTAEERALIESGSPVAVADAEPEQEEPQPQSQSPAYSNYLKEYGHNDREAISVGCIPCTRAHLSTVAASLKGAEGKDTQERVEAAREEIEALWDYDLTPDKIANTPDKDRAILEKYRGELEGLRESLKGPVPQITTASASLKESLRFARADGLDHPEVIERVAKAEDSINELERVAFSPERIAAMPPEERERVREVLPELREARQDLVNSVRTPEDLEEVTAKISVLATKLNPAPEESKLKAITQQADELNKQFRLDVLKAWRG